jgi:hypothetical protein
MPNKTPDNLKPSPMTYRVERAVSFAAQRAALAQTADSLNAEELEARAREAQIDLSGATTKEARVTAIRAQVRGAESTTEA